MGNVQDHWNLKISSDTKMEMQTLYMNEVPNVYQNFGAFSIQYLCVDDRVGVFFEQLSLKDRKMTYLDTEKGDVPKEYNGMHQNDYFDMIIVIGDRARIRIEDNEYQLKQGTVLLLNYNIVYSEIFNDNMSVIHLGVTKEFVQIWPNEIARMYRPGGICDIFFQTNIKNENLCKKEYILFIPKEGKEEKIKELIRLLSFFITNHEIGYEFFAYGYLTKIFALIESSSSYKSEKITLGKSNDKTLAESAKRYINNKKRRVTRTELSKAFNYSEDYIGRVFRKYTGYSIVEYCQLIYIEEARRLLTETNTGIGDIAVMLGFENRTQFYRDFKKHVSMTPNEYRNNYSRK